MSPVDQPFDAVIFDLGGVLVEFRGVEAMKDLAGISDDEELWRRWLGCRWVREFERGGCSADDFAHGMVDDWGLTVTPADFLADFRRWVGAPMAGVPELVAEVRRQVPAACLSNTNAEHWNPASPAWPLARYFDHYFLSFELGLVKPDPEVFAHVARSLGSPPPRLLFLDDNTLNVDAATTAGFAAARVRGVAEARRELARHGLVAPRTR